ncbi:sensor histidine kinase [Enterococcus sp. AZ196]|uniref:sensor histidine kinase n=1 Tax=Enterococcus sp. AZ196 TaxID=2774659 RepID=UPI003D280905
MWSSRIRNVFKGLILLSIVGIAGVVAIINNLEIYQNFYENIIFSLIFLGIALVTCFKADNTKIINVFIGLMVILALFFFANSVKSVLLATVSLVIFAVFPLILFYLFLNFIYPNYNGEFYQMIIGLQMICLFNLVIIFSNYDNVFLYFSTMLTSVVFCFIVYINNMKAQIPIKKFHISLLFVSILLSVIPFVISSIIKIKSDPVKENMTFPNSFYLFIILPLCVAYVLIKQHSINFKYRYDFNYQILTIGITILVTVGASKLIFGFTNGQSYLTGLVAFVSILFYIFSFSLIQKRRLDDFNKGINESNYSKESLERQINFDSFVRFLDKYLQEILSLDYDIDAFMFLWKEGSSFIKIGSIDGIVINKDFSSLSTPEISKVDGKNIVSVPIVKGNIKLGTLLLDTDREIDFIYSERFVLMMDILVELLTSRILSEHSGNFIVPETMYGAFVSNMVNMHIEQSNRTYAEFVHDEILQPVLAVKNYASLIENQDDLKKVIQGNSEMLTSKLREHIFEKFPVNITVLPLKENLQILKNTLLESNKDFDIDLHVQDDFYVDEIKKVTIYRIVRELLVNSIKHSKGNQSTVSITQDKLGIEIVAMDDGVGIDSEKMYRALHKKSNGLFSVNDKVKSLGGHIHLENANGLIITVMIPN